jgi:formate dehydrogenase major subunit
VPGLGASFGRGAATTFQQDLAHSDCVLIMGSNMAEAHPVGFRFVVQARERGARVIHVDPHFSRTSALADLYVPIRAGTDIAFLGGVIRYIIENDRWFREYVLAYTNASTIINKNFKDTEDLDGLFDGYKRRQGHYESGTKAWHYEGEPASPPSETPPHIGAESWTERLANIDSAVPPRDETLQHPRCVFQILRRHYSRYTPEVVAAICGCSPEAVVQVAEELCRNSGRERTGAIVYAVGWTQHTVGVQMIRAAGIVQLLLGNIGRPGGGIMAMRGHASIQGSTDIPTLYNLLPGYMQQPATVHPHENLRDYLEQQTIANGVWSDFPKYFISFLKAWWGEAATPDNDYGFSWLPKIDDNYSQLPYVKKMMDGKVRGYFVFGQNPAGGNPNSLLARHALRKLDWMVMLDWFETETASFWYKDPDGTPPASIKTEIFFIPASVVAEKDGSFTNTQRLLQWHDRAADPPGDCRSDLWFVYNLGRRMKRLYAGSTAARDQGLLNLTWDYADEHAPRVLPDGTVSRIEDEPDAEKVLREINGYKVAGREQLKSYHELKDDGSTACGCWIYCGVFPERDNNRARTRRRTPGNHAEPEWGWAWPSNTRILYNRASADPDGRPWSERKRYVYWDEKELQWTGPDHPDFPAHRPPSYRAGRHSHKMDAISGDSPFILKPDGKAWLFAPSGVKDGPLPTHYEPLESPVMNQLYGQQSDPGAKTYPGKYNKLSKPGDARYPIVATTCRLTEHYLSGPMSRFNSWLNELQPEMFVEMSPELAEQRQVKNGDWVTIWNERSAIEARALVTRRVRPLRVGGEIVHQVCIPFHWGYSGESVGAAANDLTSLVTDPNVSIHEAKAFVCDLRRGRHAKPRRPPAPLRMQPWAEKRPAPDTPPSAQPEGHALQESSAPPAPPQDAARRQE